MTFQDPAQFDDAAAALLAHVRPFSNDPLRPWDADAVLAYLTARDEPVEFWELVGALHLYASHPEPEQEISNPGLTTAAFILTINSLVAAGKLVARPRSAWEAEEMLGPQLGAPRLDGEMYYATADLLRKGRAKWVVVHLRDTVTGKLTEPRAWTSSTTNPAWENGHGTLARSGTRYLWEGSAQSAEHATQRALAYAWDERIIDHD